MPRPKPTAQDLRVRKARAYEWKLFRRNNMYSQQRLADILGISRRTLQQIEAGKVGPHPATLRKFAAYRKKCETSADISD